MSLVNKMSRYLETYEKNQRSLVFAPLASSYRELGMLREAKVILKKGLQFHPDYLLGHIVLSECFFDQEEFYQSYLCLKSHKLKAEDNFKFWTQFYRVCKKLNFHEEVLESLNILDVLFHGQREWVKIEKKHVEQILIPHKLIQDKKETTLVEDWEYLSTAKGNTKQTKSSALDSWEMDFQYEDSHH